MSKWTVTVKERVRKKEIPRLPKKVKLILDAALTDLANEGPFPYGWDVKKLETGKARLKLRQKWRTVYTYENDELIIQVIYAGSRENVEY